MSDFSPRLGLPYILASQAQKHVTHNEAILKLDSLVQLAVASKDVTTPPATPIEGESYIIPAGATGAWAGQEGKLGIWQGGAWVFHTPSEGWTAWVSDLDRMWSFDGSGWVQTTPPETFQNIPLLGVNTTADATNRLSVTSPATLLNNEGAGHQLKINKNAAGDTCSLLFQTAFTGHAEMGLAGADDFTVKTSDGTSWFTSLQCNSADGRVSFPVGISGRIPVSDTGFSLFIGEGAGINDDLSSNYNVFLGYQAGNANTTGSNNSAMGADALRLITTGSNNTASGKDAGRYTNAGADNTTSSNSTYIGRDTRASADGNTNETVIGHAARGNGSNTVTLGDSNITGAFVQVAWTVVSDRRDKVHLGEVPHGLDFVKRLSPVAFRYSDKRGGKATGPARYGFYAQDVLALEGDPVIVNADEADRLKLNETALIPVLVNALKEMAGQVEGLQAQIKEMKNG